MGTNLRQEDQIRSTLSSGYNDSFQSSNAYGSNLQTKAYTLADDLNALRTQFNRILGVTNWYDTPPATIQQLATITGTISTDFSKIEDAQGDTYIETDLNGTGTQNIIDFFTNSTRRMRINSTGHIGIGTTAAYDAEKVTIIGTSDSEALTINNNSWLSFRNSTNSSTIDVIRVTSGNDIQIGGSTSINVGIGTTNPNSVMLHIEGGSSGSEQNHLLLRNANNPISSTSVLQLQGGANLTYGMAEIASVRVQGQNSQIQFRVAIDNASPPTVSTVFTIDGRGGVVGIGTYIDPATVYATAIAADPAMLSIKGYQNDWPFFAFVSDGSIPSDHTENLTTSTAGTMQGKIKVYIDGTARWIPYYSSS